MPARKTILLDPQQQNSYSYARNNPINRSDPSGQLSIKNGIKNLIGKFQKWMESRKQNSSESSRVSQSKFEEHKSISIPGPYVTQMPDMTACLKSCNEMSGYNPVGQLDTAIYNSNKNVVMSTNAQKGVEIIDRYLSEGQRVTVGVNMGDGKDVGNNNNATVHFVSIVGSHYENGKKYYHFYDPGTSDSELGQSTNNRLYLDRGDYSLKGKTMYNKKFDYIVTEIKLK